MKDERFGIWDLGFRIWDFAITWSSAVQQQAFNSAATKSEFPNPKSEILSSFSLISRSRGFERHHHKPQV